MLYSFTYFFYSYIIPLYRCSLYYTSIVILKISDGKQRQYKKDFLRRASGVTLSTYKVKYFDFLLSDTIYL